MNVGDKYKHRNSVQIVTITALEYSQNRVYFIDDETESSFIFSYMAFYLNYAALEDNTMRDLEEMLNPPHSCTMVEYNTGFPNSKRFMYCKDCDREEKIA
jgi:hypothetical protein